MHFLIKDVDFSIILAILRGVKGIHLKDEEKFRLFLEAIVYKMRTGCQWRLLPQEYGKWRSIHKRFFNWAKKNVWRHIFKEVQVDPDMEWVMIDSTIIRAHACASGYGKDSQKKEALGRSRGGFTTKVHALVDALGNPLEFILTPGQRNDITQAENLTKNIENAAVIGDRGYDCDAYTEGLEQKNCDPVIPPKSNRKNPRTYDEHIYEERHLIECFFGKIKHFRGIFSRFDKSAQAYLSFLYLVGALIWLR